MKRESLHDKYRKKVSTRTGKHTILMLTGSVCPYRGKRIAVGAFFCTNRPDLMIEPGSKTTSSFTSEELEQRETYKGREISHIAFLTY